MAEANRSRRKSILLFERIVMTKTTNNVDFRLKKCKCKPQGNLGENGEV